MESNPAIVNIPSGSNAPKHVPAGPLINGPQMKTTPAFPGPASCYPHTGLNLGGAIVNPRRK